MLTTIGRESIDELFEDIPKRIRLQNGLRLDSGMSEWDVFGRLRGLSLRNRVDRISFLGGGNYDHIVPATVRYVLAKPEFSTGYTPYQAEISQGILQAVFEYQSMMCLLTGLDVSNASLYDGANAAVEACSIGLQVNRGAHTILYSQTVHPHVKQVLETHFHDRGLTLKEIPAEGGVTSSVAMESLLCEAATAVVIVQSPNFHGYLEDFRGFSEVIHRNNALFVVSANPLSLALFRTPGEWEADIAVGDTQVFGFPASYGGPSAGYITARRRLLRKMPGRIVGRTVDREGRRAFVLTLQAREQHIKRERATSNICTNQALVAVGNSVYLATLGGDGLKTVCRRNVEKAHYLHDRLVAELRIEDLFALPFFNEFTVRLPEPAATVIESMTGKGFLAGFCPGTLDHGISGSGSNAAADRRLTIAVTEKRTREELDGYVRAMKEVLK